MILSQQVFANQEDITRGDKKPILNDPDVERVRRYYIFKKSPKLPFLEWKFKSCISDTTLILHKLNVIFLFFQEPSEWHRKYHPFCSHRKPLCSDFTCTINGPMALQNICCIQDTPYLLLRDSNSSAESGTEFFCWIRSNSVHGFFSNQSIGSILIKNFGIASSEMFQNKVFEKKKHLTIPNVHLNRSF